MFGDPLNITIGASSIAFVRVKDDGYSSEYRFQDSAFAYQLLIRNTPATLFKKTGRSTARHNVELIAVVYGTGPGGSDTTRRVAFTIDNQTGDSLANSVTEAIGLCSLLTASSGAFVNRLLQMES